MTNRQILELNKGIGELEELDLPLNIRLNYNIARDRQILAPYVSIIEQQQIELYKKYGNREGNDYKVPPENVEAIKEELDELFEIENDINLVKIKLDDFGDNNVPLYVIEKLLLIIDE